MKKILLIFIVFLLLISGCGKKSREYGASAYTPSSRSSSSSAYTYTPPADSKPETEVDLTEGERFERAEKEAVSGLSPTDILPGRMIDYLNDSGISVAIENIRMMPDKTLSFRLALKTTEGNALQIPVDARYSFDKPDPDNPDKRMDSFNTYYFNRAWNFDIEWGGVSFLDNNTLIISTMKELKFFDVKTLKEHLTKLDFSEFDGKKYYLLGAKRDAGLGIVVPAYIDGKDSFAFFNENGSLRSIETVDSERTGRMYFGDRDMFPNRNFLRYQYFFEIIKSDTTYLRTERHFYDVTTHGIYEVIGATGKANYDENDNLSWRFQIIYFMYWNLGAPPVVPEKSGIVLYHDKLELRETLFFDARNLSACFGSHPVEGRHTLSYKMEEEKRVITASCDYSDVVLTADFEEKSVSFGYEIKPEHVEDDAFAVSPDGRYELCFSSFTNDNRDGSDCFNVVLREKETGALRFVATSRESGDENRGYKNNYGFLSSGDIYAQTPDRLQIFPRDSLPDLKANPFNMRLGWLPEENIIRELYTFRRDPLTKEFIILYGYRISRYVEDDDSDQRTGKAIIGLCDKDGNLLESFDTGERAAKSFDFSFRLSGDELAVTGRYNDGGHITSYGIFNLKTKNYGYPDYYYDEQTEALLLPKMNIRCNIPKEAMDKIRLEFENVEVQSSTEKDKTTPISRVWFKYKADDKLYAMFAISRQDADEWNIPKEFGPLPNLLTRDDEYVILHAPSALAAEPPKDGNASKEFWAFVNSYENLIVYSIHSYR